MPKPGQSTNVSNPMCCDDLASVRAVSATSTNTPDTFQTSDNANRFAAKGSPGPSGRAELERNDIMPDQGDANTTRATGATYAARKKTILTPPSN